ncbi:MAG TPA: hypothetical protein PKY56_03840 [Candidatus Kapabacteria bacterium]|mgnify:FL=1|nr:hypothetical protein [Candidatus Kapabacteria bacterium]HPO62035.1 hypothetical protein [Candidatus Kapabacteria bacterium]
MQIIHIKKVLGCLESFNAKDVFFEKEIKAEFVEHLGKLGKLIHLKELEKPFFKVIVKGKYTIKGSETNNSMRIVFSNTHFEDDLEKIIDYVKRF